MIDKRKISRKHEFYKEFKNGFQVLGENGVNNIEFEKASVFTNPTLRDIIKERYEHGIIYKMCQTCKKDCKQVIIRGVKFTCYQREKK